MSDGRPKPSIPAWQRAPVVPATEDPVSGQPTPEPSPETKVEDVAPESESVTAAETQPPADDATSATPQKTATVSPSAGFGAVDVDAFRQAGKSTQTSSQPPPVAQAPPTVAAPPIITYPEFLVRAHRAPPLITPTRIFNTIYAAGGLAALLYGTSNYLVAPMVASLSESRHDLLGHSRSKVDEFNERLSKLVSKVPTAAKDKSAGDLDSDDAESISSDPTELYHRDMGTQTDLVPPSTAQKADPENAHEAALAHDLKALAAIQASVKELIESTERNVETAQERMVSMTNLRHYLDTMCYSSAGINVWSGSEDKYAQGGASSKSEDPIEELKKEIRSVKGVLLSAKRFPSYATGGRGGAAVGLAS